MDIEFIEEEHRDNIFKIMELCNCDMAEAYELYNNNGCNVENAVQAKFNTFDSHSSGVRNYQQDYHEPQSYGNNGSFGFSNSQFSKNEEDDYENYKIAKQTGLNFGKRYQVRRDTSKGVFSFFKSNQNTFKKNLQYYIGKKYNLQLENGSLSQALQSISKEKFPLIAHVLDFSKDPTILNNIKRVYSEEFLVQMMSEQFKNYGISTKQYNLQPFLKQFIDLKTDANHLLIFRTNITDEVVLMTKIPLMSTSVDEIKKKLKQIKSNCINIQMEEMHFEKRFQEQLRGNFDYQKPMSLAEKRKLQQDRQIRRKQQEQFFAAMQPKQQQTKPSSVPSSNQYGTQTKPQVQAVKKDNKVHALQERKKIRNSLKIYESDGEGMLAIKLRLPSSELMKLYVHSSQPAQYLYDYVFSREQDLGFEEDQSKRVFDIIEPYEKINLSERKKQALGKIFEGETMLTLVVNQKSE